MLSGKSMAEKAGFMSLLKNCNKLHVFTELSRNSSRESSGKKRQTWMEETFSLLERKQQQKHRKSFRRSEI
jgi:hypothetical protein